MAAAVLVWSGCVRVPPDYLRPLRPGASALQKVADSDGWPDLEAAFQGRDRTLADAVEQSLTWFESAAGRSPYPFSPLGISHRHARASVAAFGELLRTSASAAEFRARAEQEFDLYVSVGWNGAGEVLFTGYYAPVFRASRVRDAEHRHPLYRKPQDLEPGGVFATRAQIERDPSGVGLAGRELAWMASKLDAFLVQVQGSARLDLVGGGPPLYIDYAASNGREYTSIGQLLVRDGKIERARLNIPTIRAYFASHPEELDSYLNRNERYVFFQEGSPGRWPVGSLGVEVTPLRTLATDKAIYPRGCVVLARTHLVSAGGESRPFEQFMLDQDAGGGIRSPGRADIYVGVGDEAGEIAGRQAHKGRLYYFLLKPDRVDAWDGMPAPERKPTGRSS